MDSAVNSFAEFWMPFTANRQFKKAPRLLVGAKDMHYTSHDGRQILDSTAGLWCVNAGHCRPRITEAIARQAATMDYAPVFQMGHPQAFELASRVAGMLPDGLEHVFFSNSGSEAVDTALTAGYFALFSVSLFLWSAQAIYARAFYAAGNTLVPMVAGTVVTLVSLPVYATLFHLRGTAGLAMASDIGIGLQTLSLAVLLHQRRMVSLASLDYRELGRCLVAGVVGGTAIWAAIFGMGRFLPGHSRWMDTLEIIVGSALWVVIAGTLLDRLGSALPRATLRRLGVK